MIYVAHDSTSEPLSYSIPLLEEVFQFRYIDKLEFAHYEVEQRIKKRCQKAYRQGYLDPLTLWLGKLHKEPLEKEDTSFITLRWVSDEIGYGIFTRRLIKQWECIGHYAGLVRRRELLKSNVNGYCFMYPREWVSYVPYTIDSEREGNFTRFINHSDDPNLESIGAFYNGVLHVLLRAIKEIPAGAELTYDYGKDYWRKRKKIA